MDRAVSVVREGLKARIEHLLKPLPSPKLLFGHQDLLSLLNFAYEFRFREIMGSGDSIFEFEEDSTAVDRSNASALVFFLHPLPSTIATIASMVFRNESNSINKQYKVFFVPKPDELCLAEINRHKLTGKIEVSSFDFGLIAFPGRLMSLEVSPNCHEVDAINGCVQSLLLLFKAAGQISRIVGKGERSQLILKQLEKTIANEDLFLGTPQREDSLLVVLDRSIDLVTPLLTGHSYESLIDLVYGISLGSVTLPNRLLGNEAPGHEDYRLYNRDMVYDNLAHMDLVQSLSSLEKAGESIKKELIARKQAATTPKDFQEVTSVWGVRFAQVNNHRAIINSIVDVSQQTYFQNLIRLEMQLLDNGTADFEELRMLSLSYVPEHLLRLICLWSQLYPQPSFYTRHEKEILEVMACDCQDNEQIYNLHLLQKMGLLRNSKTKNKWQQVCKAYDLLPVEPHSYTRVYAKYSALSVRYLEMLIKGRLSPQTNALLGKDNNYLRGLEGEGRRLKELVVFYVGGITYGEISCLRLLERQLGISITVLTTSLTNGITIIRNNLHAMAL